VTDAPDFVELSALLERSDLLYIGATVFEKRRDEVADVAIDVHKRTTARKARLVANVIRGLSVNRALEVLEFSPQRAAAMFLKVVKSAAANAAQDEGVNVNRLVISECMADDGPLLQNRLRWRPGPQGRALPIRKRTAHLTVVVREMEQEGS
jgi:large subunit ribosomal protein L22